MIPRGLRVVYGRHVHKVQDDREIGNWVVWFTRPLRSRPGFCYSRTDDGAFVSVGRVLDESDAFMTWYKSGRKHGEEF